MASPNEIPTSPIDVAKAYDPAANAASKEALKSINNRTSALTKSGMVAPQTIKDSVTKSGMAIKPGAVESLMISDIVAFRRKVFALLCMQGLGIWAISAVVARLGFIQELGLLSSSKDLEELKPDFIIVGISWLVTIICLTGLAWSRYKWPLNMVMLAIFSTFAAISLALSFGPNVVFGMASATCCVLMIAIPSCIVINGKLCEVFPVSVFSSFVITVGVVVGWQVLAPEIGVGWVVASAIMNIVATVWLGYEIDWLCSRLNPDEFLLPLVLVWAEMIIAIAVTLILFVAMVSGGGDADGGGGGGCCTCGTGYPATCAYMHCDCWLYGSGDSSARRRQQGPEGNSGGEAGAPPQNDMAQSV